ncbi:hypothetical protein ACFQ09_02830 [Massilia norwichensis]|uniref:Uncharacterized protein n=1 Tax=Massilia norwichensis TaxID=1442366 RepID=A0ABT2A4Z1_9BURK|nr:hypothetical protein [Massilia norwichensis]MCS0589150.1 hypothetical protein [Massilia norwichensis]
MSAQNGTKDPREPMGADVVGGGGNQHNDWGHSDVGGNKQSTLDDVVGSDTGRPEEEAGELQTGLGGTESLSTGNAGSRQSADKQ